MLRLCFGNGSWLSAQVHGKIGGELRENSGGLFWGVEYDLGRIGADVGRGLDGYWVGVGRMLGECWVG